MRPRDRLEAQRLRDALDAFERGGSPLPGAVTAPSRAALIEQILESERRDRYVRQLGSRQMSVYRGDPDSDLFDPLRAAALRRRAGDREEAIWLVFLFIHFGHSSRGGWTYAREVCKGAGPSDRWDWAHVRADPDGFENWVLREASRIRRTGGRFGNHRKYERFEDTGAVVKSYVDWVGGPSQGLRLDDFVRAAGGDPRAGFSAAYDSLVAVQRFGRTARFDFLATLGRLQLASIIPAHSYIETATGPARGAALLFRGAADRLNQRGELAAQARTLGDVLGVGPDVIEDALCNWQKSPERFTPFRA
jgi:Alpha-glutamyl/putrescinyl thymine pyrophosphorylase clade 3